MTTSAYKGKNVFVSNAGSEYVSMGGRNAEMTFGIGTISYAELYGTTGRLIAGGPNDATTVNLEHLPSDAVAAKKYGAASTTASKTLQANRTYVVTAVDGTDDNATDTTPASLITAGVQKFTGNTGAALTGHPAFALGDVLVVGATADTLASAKTSTVKEVTIDNAFVKELEYEVVTIGASFGDTTTARSDAKALLDATSITGASITAGTKFTVNSGATVQQMAALNSLTDGATFRRVGATNELTQDIEAVQAKVNTARVQAGSQYAAMESAVDYTTDLTAQYELGFNTVNDVNFSMETAHLAKNQILQQAATAMLAQANQGQQGLLQLIQG
jgi:flagellin-like hook-associated protein FlgL